MAAKCIESGFQGCTSRSCKAPPAINLRECTAGCNPVQCKIRCDRGHTSTCCSRLASCLRECIVCLLGISSSYKWCSRDRHTRSGCSRLATSRQVGMAADKPTECILRILQSTSTCCSHPSRSLLQRRQRRQIFGELKLRWSTSKRQQKKRSRKLTSLLGLVATGTGGCIRTKLQINSRR